MRRTARLARVSRLSVSYDYAFCDLKLDFCSYFSISYQLLIKPLLYAQAFVFKTFHIFSPVSTSLSHEITIKTPLTSKKYRLANFARSMRKARCFISREKQVFLVGFSLKFPRFPQISKNRLNTSLGHYTLTENPVKRPAPFH